MNSRKHWVVAALVGLNIASAVFVWRAWFPGAPFDPIRWSDERQVANGVRLGMADRLIARKTLNGMTHPEVVAMLGEPPYTGYFAAWDLVYWLGPERGYLSIDSEWLVIRLGVDGRVSEYRLARD